VSGGIRIGRLFSEGFQPVIAGEKKKGCGLDSPGIVFLLLNASVVWAVVAGLLTWVLRSKLLVLVIMIAPYIIGSSFRSTPGMAELIGMYSTSLIYGAPGIIFGMLYADYQRVKSYFTRVSKSSFLARGGIALSSVYLLGYFGQRIIFGNPAVQFFLGFIDGGERAQELVSRVDYDGAVTSGVVIASSFGVLAFNGWRQQREAAKAAENQRTLEAP
jgi:hypothetical protein